MKCKLCGNEMKCIINDGCDYFILHGKGKKFQIFYCKECGIGYTYPEMSTEELTQYYPDTYEAYNTKNGLLDALQEYKYSTDVKMLKKYMKKGKNVKVYEIGCGRGQFLAYLKKHWSAVCTLHGAEQSSTGVRNALEQYNMVLECKDADSIVFEQKYDVVILRNVLEHLNNFDKIIENIFQNGLESGGILFVKVPKMNSYEAKKFGKYWHGYDMPRHRIHFTDEGIEKLFRKIGFTNIIVKNEVVPSDYDRSLQYQKRNMEYKKNKLKFLRYMFIELKLLLYKNAAGRMIIIAEKK